MKELLMILISDENVQKEFMALISIVAGLCYKEFKKHFKNIDLEKVAYDAWFITEEYFRLNPSAKTSVIDKVALFECYIKQKYPKITQEQLNWLNKSVAGAMNIDKKSTVTLPEVSITDK